MALIFDLEKQLGSLKLELSGEIGPGVTALFGPSGAGKSSLIALLAGLMRPDKGRITAFDQVLVDVNAGRFVPPHRRLMGCVFQQARLFPHLTVAQNLSFSSWVTGRSLDRARRDELVDLLGLSALMTRRPARLSGGEKQRVALARAILSTPRFLLMDEPMASLDQKRKAEILPYLEELHSYAGVPIMYVSHSIDEVKRLATHVVRIEAGRIVASGTVDVILSGERELL